MKTLALTNPPMRGTEVRRAQTNLNTFFKRVGHAAQLKVDECFGPITAHHCVTAKFYLGYPSKLFRPTYGTTLDSYLTGRVKLPSSYRIRAHRRRSAGTIVTRLRSKIVANAHWGVSHKDSIHYEQLRPIDGLNHPYKLPLYTDCSGFITDCYKWAGAPDPNGFDYNGQGYTGSLLNHMHRIAREQLRPADLIVYGAYPGEHVVMYVGGGNVISNGGEIDPSEYTEAVMASAFPGREITYLTLPRW